MAKTGETKIRKSLGRKAPRKRSLSPDHKNITALHVEKLQSPSEQIVRTNEVQLAVEKPKQETIDSVSLRIYSYTLELFSLVFWVFVSFKTLIFDVDLFLLQYLAPEYVWVSNYRSIVLLSLLAGSLLLLSRRRFISSVLFVVFYPLVVLLWRIPKYTVISAIRNKNWLVPFAVLNSLVMFFKSLKYFVITRSLWVIAFVLAVSFSNRVVLSISIAALFCVLIVTYFYHFKAVFSRNPLYSASQKLTLYWSDSLKQKEVIGGDVLSVWETIADEEKKRWSEGLESTLLFNRLSLFCAKRLTEYQKSGLSLAAGIFSMLSLAFWTVLTFAAIHYAVAEIDPAQFKFENAPSFFLFFYYSFNSIVYNFISQVSPVGTTAIALWMIEASFALILLAFLVALVMSLQHQKEVDEVSEVVRLLEFQGKQMEDVIKTKYGIFSVEDAIQQLSKLKGDALQLIIFISNRIN